MNYSITSSRRIQIPLVASTFVLVLVALPLANSLNVIDSLTVQGTTNLNTVSNSTNAAIGSSNYLGSGVSSSIAVGSNNYIVGPAVGTVVAGTGNAVETATKSGVFGKDHYVSGSQTLVGGTLNGVEGTYGFSYGFTNWVAANATSAMAGGQYTIANGVASAALGNYTMANGTASTSLGNNTKAYSFASVAIGQYNAKAPTSSDEDTNTQARTTWRGQDTLFVIGNGTGSGATPRKNAFLVTKDGTIIIQKQGDISMGSYTAP